MPRQKHQPILALLAIQALMVAWLGFYPELVQLDLSALSSLAAVVAVVALVAVGVGSRLGMWSTGFVYVLLLVAFHLGVSLAESLPVDVPAYGRSYSDSWMGGGTEDVNVAVWLCAGAALTFAVGYCMDRRPETQDSPDGSPSGAGLATVGLVLVVVGSLLFLGYAAIAAPELLRGGDKTLFEATIAGSPPVAYGILLSTLGVVLAAVAPPSPRRTRALAIFGGYALITLAIGSRTAAMYAIVVVVVLLARRRGQLPRQRVAAWAVFFGLLLVSVSNQVREDGLRGATLRDFVGSPGAALNEMGWSLRPVIETIRAVDSGAADLRYGGTYTVAFQRYIESLVGATPPEPDPRWPAAIVSQDRSDGLQIGFSTIAEGYMNFGLLGAIAAFAVLGWAFGRWDRATLDVYGLARVGVVVLALLPSIRNGSNTVLLTILLGFVAITVARRLPSSVPDSGDQLASRPMTPGRAVTRRT